MKDDLKKAEHENAEKLATLILDTWGNYQPNKGAPVEPMTFTTEQMTELLRLSNAIVYPQGR